MLLCFAPLPGKFLGPEGDLELPNAQDKGGGASSLYQDSQGNSKTPDFLSAWFFCCLFSTIISYTVSVYLWVI